MKQCLSIIKSSFHDIRCCDETATQTNPDTGVTTSWRALQASVTCVVDANGTRTGYAHVATLEQFDTANGTATGTTKANQPSDSNYIPDYPDSQNCSIVASTNIVELFSNSNALTNIVLTKGTDVYNLSNDLPYSKMDIKPGSYQLDITVYADENHPNQDLKLSVNNGQFDLVNFGNSVQFQNVPTPIKVVVNQVVVEIH